MELMTLLLTDVAIGIATAAGTTIYNKAAQTVQQWLETNSISNREIVVRELGAASPSRIRALVQKALVDKGKIPLERREEVVGVLLRLAGGARMVSMQGGGTTGSQISGDANLIFQQLIENLKSVRHVGELVSEQSRDWRLEQFLGAGTFGEVWLASNVHAPALKHAYKFFTHGEAKIWLQREYLSLVEVQKKLVGDAHIVKLINIAPNDRPYPYLSLEYIDGGSLEDWILEDPQHRPPLVKSEIISGIVEAIAQAHERKVYHRDLKPGNILLTSAPEIEARITDFGLADVRRTDSEAFRRSVYTSHAAAQVGTPMYWPPEAWLPYARRNAAQDDVFAIGVVWYQLLVERLERPPYDFAEVLAERQADSRTIRLISRCLARTANRFKDAGELRELLQIVEPPDMVEVPKGMFDVQYLAREYLTSRSY